MSEYRFYIPTFMNMFDTPLFHFFKIRSINEEFHIDEKSKDYIIDEQKKEFVTIEKSAEIRLPVNSMPSKGLFNRIKKWFKRGSKNRDNTAQIGQIMYKISEKMKFADSNRCIVRIAPLIVPRKTLFMNIDDSPYTKHEEIKISSLMSCEIFEINNAKQSNFKISCLSSKEQQIEADDFTEWLFDVFPLQLGYHALIIKVTKKEFIENHGVVSKDVLVLNREIIVQNLMQTIEIDFQTQNNAILEKNLKKATKKLLTLGETGSALCSIANYSNFKNLSEELNNSIILLQSRFHKVMNEYNLGTLKKEDWNVETTKIDQAILFFLDEIYGKNLEISGQSIQNVKGKIDRLVNEPF
jgi:Effector-associated domain 11